MNREDAWALLCEYTQSAGLRKHALAVEAAMRAYARKFGEDDEKWAIVGLLHDFDYEIHPTLDQHPQEGAKILRERGYKGYLSIEYEAEEDPLLAVPRFAGYLQSLVAW